MSSGTPGIKIQIFCGVFDDIYVFDFILCVEHNSSIKSIGETDFINFQVDFYLLF